jgi:hypothetical protein
MTARANAAGVIADLVRTRAGLDLPVRLRLWDGSDQDRPGARSWSPAPRGRCAASCGARVSSAWPATRR